MTAWLHMDLAQLRRAHIRPSTSSNSVGDCNGGVQVLTMLAPIRCLFWSAQHSTLAVGQERCLAFFTMESYQVLVLL